MVLSFLLPAGQSHPAGKKNQSLLKEKNENRKVPHAGDGLVPMRDASGRDPSLEGGPTVRDLAPRAASGDPVRPTPGAGGGPSPPTEASGPRAARLAAVKGQGRETEAGARGRAPPTAGAGRGQGVAAGGQCFAAALLTGETGGSASQVTRLSLSYASSAALGPALVAAPARLLHGSLNWVKKTTCIHVLCFFFFNM